MPLFRVQIWLHKEVANPFLEHAAFEQRTVREWEIEAKTAKDVRALFDEAKAENMPHVAGCDRIEITEIV